MRQCQRADHDDSDTGSALQNARGALKLRQPLREGLTERVARPRIVTTATIPIVVAIPSASPAKTTITIMAVP